MFKFWQIKEVRVAILVIGALVLVYIGLSYLRGRSVVNRPMIFSSLYKDVDGLQKGSQVRLNGFAVGMVRELTIDPKTYLIRVSYEVDRTVKIPKDSYAMIASFDLLGTKGIKLLMGKSDKFAITDDMLQDSLEMALSAQLQAQLGPVKDNLNTTILSVNEMVSSLAAILRDTVKYQGMVSDLALITRNFGSASGDFKNISTKLDTASGSLKLTLAALERQSATLERIIANSGIVTDSLAAASADLKASITAAKGTITSLDALTSQLKSGNGSLGKLFYNDSLYTNLSNTTESLNKLFIDLQAHPKRYVHFSLFGKKDKADKEKKKAEAAAGQ